MRVVFFMLGVLLVFSACSTSNKCGVSEYEFQRSNSASQKALQVLDRE